VVHEALARQDVAAARIHERPVRLGLGALRVQHDRLVGGYEAAADRRERDRLRALHVSHASELEAL
jgi:hypothetical protein